MSPISTKDVTEILPPEVWGKIFENLEDSPHTLLQCCRTCNKWNDLLTTNRVYFLLPSVLIKVEKYLHVNDFLTCRLVCKQWKRYIDQYIQNPTKSSLCNWNCLSSNEFNCLSLPWAFTLRNTKHLKNFMSAMQIRKSNPFPTRTMIVRSDKAVSEDNAKLYSVIEDFAPVFGLHIWTCVYLIDGRIPESIQQIWSIFCHLSNLQSLTLVFRCFPEMPSRSVGLSWLRGNVLPQMKHLKSLSIFGDNIEVVADSLLEAYGNQLESLDCNVTSVNKSKYFSPKRIQGVMTSGHTLSVRKYERYHSSPMQEDFLLLTRTILTMKIPLRNLFLHFSVSCSLVTILRIVNKFSETIVELHLPVDLVNSKADGESKIEIEKEMDIKLVKIKNLSISYTLLNSPWIINVLEKFTTVNHLEFVNFEYNSYKFHGKTGFRAEITPQDRLCLYKQTEFVWYILPNLKKLWVSVCLGNGDFKCSIRPFVGSSSSRKVRQEKE